MTRLNPLMRIEDHFRETLEQHESGLTDREIRTRSLETLGQMGIPPTRFRQYPHEFSGGMRQRIMIALALVLRPKLLVADEPTTSLDVIVEAQILGILADLRRNFGTALLLITHNLGIVAEACDRVAVMYAGKIVEEGTPGTCSPTPPTRTRASSCARRSRSTPPSSTRSRARRPNLIDPPPACRFHPRCPSAMVVCADEDPVEQTLDDGRRVLCWLHGPDGARSPRAGRRRSSARRSRLQRKPERARRRTTCSSPSAD